MFKAWKRAQRRRKYGEPVIIVSGLPRSGTSMMMRMLEAGGLSILTDEERTADEDNPKGYYEYERVKDLENETDKSYVAQARGKVLKVISHLLKDLPSDNYYQILFMRRDLDEVVASQNKMLQRRGEENPLDDQATKDYYLKHLVQCRFLVRNREYIDMIEVKYGEALAEPEQFVAQVDAFLDHELDTAAMSAQVDKGLYRNRGHKLRADSKG
ncbi:MAG: sulfotransferase family protein [Acidobacteria bacterium]|nr:sulfotransferase family protein [Acidobacteriota bacterium]